MSRCQRHSRPRQLAGKSTWPVLVVLAATLVAAGCASQPTRSSSEPQILCNRDSDSAQCVAARQAHMTRMQDYLAAKTTMAEAALAAEAVPGWQMQGRAAISSGRNAGNVRIEWNQRDNGDYRLSLAAPVTRQSWALDVTSMKATLHGLPNGPVSADDAELLLRQQTGWDIPLQSMRDWLHGLPSPRSEAHDLRFREHDLALLGFDQDGWKISYERPGPDARPGLITATRGDSRVRLVIDQWREDRGD